MTKRDSMSQEKKISAKHIAVIESYISNGFKREQAMIDAGYGAARARRTASDVFKRPEVKAYLAERMKELQMSADEALLRLGGHAAGNVAEFIGLTIDEIKAHPRAALIKRIKFVTHFPEPAIPNPLNEDEDGDDQPAVEIEAPKPIQLVESIELYDAQSAMLNVIKQSQLATGQPTENVNVPALSRLLELLEKAGKDPNSVFSRMADKLESDQA